MMFYELVVYERFRFFIRKHYIFINFRVCMEIRVRLRTLNIVFTFLILALILALIILYLANARRVFSIVLIYFLLLVSVVVIFNVGFRVGFDALRSYFRVNWGAPFIIVFMILLLIAAGNLAYGFEDAANSLAIYAYYALVLGVVLQLICYLKYGGDRDD